jgi:hypothetical protein
MSNAQSNLKVFLASHWVPGALISALALLAVMPIFARTNWPQTLIFLHLPAYMLHQVEEHTNDRFRAFVNQRMFGGLEALTVEAVLWINIPGVWGLNLLALYIARFGDPGFALAAPYFMQFNAVVHLIPFAKTRAYNPGLVTGLLLFVPLAATTLYVIKATLMQHMLGAAIAAAFQVVIIAIPARRAARLRTTL